MLIWLAIGACFACLQRVTNCIKDGNRLIGASLIVFSRQTREMEIWTDNSTWEIGLGLPVNKLHKSHNIVGKERLRNSTTVAQTAESHERRCMAESSGFLINRVKWQTFISPEYPSCVGTTSGNDVVIVT